MGDVFTNGHFVADRWRDLRDDDVMDSLDHVHMPMHVYLDNKRRIEGGNGALGLVLTPGDDVGLVGAHIGIFASIAVAFPVFTDGRGYSSARLLRERYSFAGELRARGDILIDQVAFLFRCGFDALTVTDRATRKALQEHDFDDVSIFMQPVGASAEVPLGTRPFLRRAGTEAWPGTPRMQSG